MAMPAKDLKQSARPGAKPAAVRSVALVSLGCPKNLVDSERMLGLLAGDGIAVTADAAQADAIAINTCGFLAPQPREAHKRNPQSHPVQNRRPLQAGHRRRLPGAARQAQTPARSPRH